MLITIDKRGSINLPAALRKDLGLGTGSYLELMVDEGGAIILHPVTAYKNVRLNERGLSKLKEARESGKDELPDWLKKEMKDASADPDPEIS